MNLASCTEGTGGQGKERKRIGVDVCLAAASQIEAGGVGNVLMQGF
jgi:hypothetical protein